MHYLRFLMSTANIRGRKLNGLRNPLMGSLWLQERTLFPQFPVICGKQTVDYGITILVNEGFNFPLFFLIFSSDFLLVPHITYVSMSTDIFYLISLIMSAIKHPPK